MGDQQGSSQAEVTVSLGPASPGLQAAYLGISFILIVAANSLLILLVCRKEYLQQPRHYLRCHLAFNDILFTTAQIPRYIHLILQSNGRFYGIICSDTRIVSATALLSTYATYLLMAIDLYYYICHPLKYETKVTTKRLAIVLGLVDAFSIICGAVPIALVRKAEGNVSCLMKTRTYQPAFVLRSIGIVLQILSLPVIIGLYYVVLKEAKRQQQRDEQRPVKFYKTKGFKTMFPHVVVFTTSVISAIFMTVTLAEGNEQKEGPSMAVVIVEKAAILLCLTLSPLLNPVVYTLRLPEFRRAVREMCGRPPTAAVAPALPNLPRVHVIEVRPDSTLNDV
ncbi:PREDICTED: olfactory receptor 6C65-like [Branchiostoma belcheri]|uniref:Olfactory receptor 6C65-like n=1 Tax=Branchiostoma belcheri TaxID=7741 RepID=A0A6P4ZDU6_BRABE|nr:PREDICTED: olfactory receptor 6C65-like [Branchiostoma belcheri]